MQNPNNYQIAMFNKTVKKFNKAKIYIMKHK